MQKLILGSVKTMLMIGTLLTLSPQLFGQESNQKQDFEKARRAFYQTFNAEKAERFKAISQVHFVLEGFVTNPRQAYNPSKFDDNSEAESFEGHWFYDFQNRMSREYVREVYHGEHDLRFEELNRNDSTYYITTQMRKFSAVAAKFETTTEDLIYNPGIFLSRIEFQIASLTWVGRNDKHIILEITWLNNRRRLYLDAQSYRLDQISWLSGDAILGDRLNTIKFIGRKELNDFPVPERIEKYLDNDRIEHRMFQAFQTNSGPKGVFELDSDLDPFQLEPWSLEKVSEHVYQITGLGGGLYTIPIVVFQDFVLMYDAILSGGLIERALTLIKKKFNRPVRFVVLSHNHTDHIKGLVAFKGIGIEFVTSEVSKQRIAQFMNAPTSLRQPDIPAKNEETNYTTLVVSSEQPEQIENHDVRVNVQNLGASPHAEGLLYLLVETDNVVIQADGYFEFSKWGIAFDKMVDWVESLDLTNPIILGVHHSPIKLEDLKDRRRQQLAGIKPQFLRK